MRDLEKQLHEDFADREYREAYAIGFLNTWISQQLTTVRRQRGLTQDQLAALVGTKQSGVSRMERDDYGRWNFGTLQKVSFALGCRLKVSLETFGSLIKEAVEFSDRFLERPSFDQDPIFTGQRHYELAPAGGGALGEMKRKVIPWLLNNGPKEQLADWLQGYDLPAVGDEIPPSEWLLNAIIPGPDELRHRLAEYLNRAIEERWDIDPPSRRKEELVRNLLRVAKGLRLPRVLGDAMWEVFSRRSDLAVPGSLAPLPGHPLVGAIMHNQADDRYADTFWIPSFLEERSEADVPEYAAAGMVGMAHAGLSPNALGIVQAANCARHWNLPRATIIRILRGAFEATWTEFAETPQIKVDVVVTAETTPEGWSQDILSAWRRSLGTMIPSQPAGTHKRLQHAIDFVDNAAIAQYKRLYIAEAWRIATASEPEPTQTE